MCLTMFEKPGFMCLNVYLPYIISTMNRAGLCQRLQNYGLYFPANPKATH